MNYYFLLEDEKSFLKILPHWISHIGLNIQRVADISELKNNNYILQSGQGVTQLITRVLYQTIDTIISNPGTVDKLVVILDSEEQDVETTKQIVYDKIQAKYMLEELDFDIQIFVCNHCIETWLLGCDGIVPNTIPDDSIFKQYFDFYNVALLDPELMGVPEERRIEQKETIAKYHFHYLHDLLLSKRDRSKRYTKSKPEYVSSSEYFNGIKTRCIRTTDISSFKEFIDFLDSQKGVCNP